MVTIEIDDEQFIATADLSGLESSIFNDAKSLPSPSGRWGGYPYFWPVDLGRGPVNPVYAKALRIPIGNGQFIFRKSAGPSAPRNIRKIAAIQIDSAAINSSITA